MAYICMSLGIKGLTLYLLTWRIWWAPNNASIWEMGFDLASKGLVNRSPTMYQDVLVTKMQHHYYYNIYIYINMRYIYLSYVFCEDVHSLTTLVASVTLASHSPNLSSGAESHYQLLTAFISWFIVYNCRDYEDGWQWFISFPFISLKKKLHCAKRKRENVDQAKSGERY
jgi:hypothetical protein